MDRLQASLEQHKDEIEDSLVAARAELDALQAKERELVGLIERAEAMLGKARPAERLTLHEAMVRVLEENDGGWMTTREVADEINRRHLYNKRDGSPVESNQIHARAKNYAHLFEKDHQFVRLRREPLGRKRLTLFPPSKYDGLRDHLARDNRASVVMTLDEISELAGSLPPSARLHRSWWANKAVLSLSSPSNVQARSWLVAGYRVTDVDLEGGMITFGRQEPDGHDDDGLAGVREPRREPPNGPADRIVGD